LNKIKEKPCYYCHNIKNIIDMQEIGVWICNECLEKSKTPNKKKK